MKRVGNAYYVHESDVDNLPKYLGVGRTFLDKLIEGVQERHGHPEWNVIKVARIKSGIDSISLLSYPGFSKETWPELSESWLYNFKTAKESHRKYSSNNPPILHRKELFLPPDADGISEMKEITKYCEVLGLFEDTKRIGRKKFWQALLKEKGYKYGK